MVRGSSVGGAGLFLDPRVEGESWFRQPRSLSHSHVCPQVCIPVE